MALPIRAVVLPSFLQSEPPSSVAFWFAFVTTVVLLVVALITGFSGRRRLHLIVGPTVMVSLAITIVLTEQLVRRYEFPAAALELHLLMAKAGALLALPVIVTGIWLWRRPARRRWHRVSVFVWLTAVLAATGSGLWIFTLATLKTG